MAVTRLRTRRDAREQTALEALRDMLAALDSDGLPKTLVGQLVATVEHELSSRSGWGFVMVDPVMFDAVVSHLFEHSRRPQTAVKVWVRLFAHLPFDSNEVLINRKTLAR